MKRPTAFCAGPTARRGCIRSLQTYDARIFISGKSFHEPPPHPACGHPLPALRGEGRERGANLVHGPNACEKREGASHEPEHPLTLPSPPLRAGERVSAGRERGRFNGSQREVLLRENLSLRTVKRAKARAPWPHFHELGLLSSIRTSRCGKGIEMWRSRNRSTIA